MKKYFSVTIIGLTIFITSCSGMSPTPIPAATSNEGKTYSKQCGSCHAVPHPKRLSFGGWKNLLPIMEMRIKERGMTKLSETDKEKILRYLKMHAQ